MRKVLWWLLGGSRGGRNRLRIIRALDREPMNANQLAETLDLDYKTIRHHLELLGEHDVVTTMGDGYGTMYFLSDRMEQHLDVLDEVAEAAGLGDVDG
ncbi:winged helix-turn-helix domain-containing protein [Halanaeroarchaeum sp. HSR-CO]|uniref:winged helix-turn-helix domain-containing protein n=1 Tax=Halanaeroarchaeum sp. HSR-CO TaxID=2866382 RepID=UPI00217EB8A5|nr:winged helix-turn-helix domain-containing protein [Halanaeroarchaeum sp. HSR-CO]